LRRALNKIYPALIFSTASAFFALAGAAKADIRPNTLGFYPIWESTGYVEHAEEIYAGTSSVHLGVADEAQVGVEPLLFMYRTPNVNVKLATWNNDRWNFATHVGYFHLMEEASRSFMSPMYTSRLDNPDFAVNMAQIAGSASYHPNGWLTLHQTLTALPVFASGPLNNEVTFGYSAVAELMARHRHSILFHATEVGFWNHDQDIVGASYRYQNNWLELRFGYFYRITSEAAQSSPLISVGVSL
jgi:hypothetical protein